jgi:ADP-ribosylglycohydrolase
MSSNRDTLERLLDKGGVDLKRSTFLDTAPAPLPADFSYDRIEGMLLGLAVGDALGNTSEAMNPSDRRARYGEIRDYLPHRYGENKPVGLPTDDTQLAFWTLERLVESGKLVPEDLSEIFATRQIFGIGQTVSQFIRNFNSGLSWESCGPRSAGNGALMRIFPILIPHLRHHTTALWADTILASMLTHNDSASTSACVAFVAMAWDLLGRGDTPESGWWANRYVQIACELEGDRHFRPRGGDFTGYSGSLSQFVFERLPDALEKNLSAVEACDSWYSGAFLLETVPSALYILAKHGHDFEEAVIRAVNDTRDNDTIAAIVGAVLGALHGRQAIPDRWIHGLLGRTGADDDGKVFDLIDRSRATFWNSERP